jgi:hypothetical protein
MTAAEDLLVFGGFDAGQANASLWVFKKRPVTGDMNPFTAVSVLMSDTLLAELKELVAGYQSSHTISEEYGLLTQPSEGGFLSVARTDTLFPNLQAAIDQPLEEHLVKNVKQLNNAAGYVFRLRHDDKILYCVKRTTADWATRKKKGYMNIFFKESGLDISDDPSFSIARQFDFFVTGDHVLMSSKTAFESLLNHKDSYEEAYAQLKVEAGFVSAFSDMAPLDAFVGTNATQLRRMTVIRARGYYKDPNYLSRLKEVSDTRSWGIQFDDVGRIVATEETMRAIMHVLLDHRLRSELSENQYDVPSTSLVG